MIIHIPGSAAKLPFAAPHHACCNCGAPLDAQMLDTKLKHTRYMLLAGVETTFVLALPFCGTCKASAKRFRQGHFSRALVAFGLFWVLLGLLMFAGDRLPSWMQEHILSAAALSGIALTSAFYLSRRARAPATSYYQPVFLRRLKQSFKGDIQSITLGFTNEIYATQFAMANASYCQSGALVVEKI